MGFPKVKPKATAEVNKDYVTVGAIWDSKDYPGSFSFGANDYAGELYFRRKIKDDEGNEIGEQFYKINYLNLLEPKDFGKGIPERLQYQVSVNLANPKAAELQDAAELTEEDIVVAEVEGPAEYDEVPA